MIRGNLVTFLPSSPNLGFRFRHAAAADKRTPEDYEGVGGQETHDGRVIMRRVFGADGIERASGESTDGRKNDSCGTSSEITAYIQGLSKE